MKKIVSRSDQIPPTTDRVDSELITILSKASPIINYIPFNVDPQRKYYKERQEYYSRLGMNLPA